MIQDVIRDSGGVCKEVYEGKQSAQAVAGRSDHRLDDANRFRECPGHAGLTRGGTIPDWVHNYEKIVKKRLTLTLRDSL